jgi:predicted ABC-type ATPase
MDSMIFNTEKALERADELVKEGGWEVPEGITPEAYDRIRDQREGK